MAFPFSKSHIMPTKLFIVPLLFVSMLANAQDQPSDPTKTHKPKLNELGLLGETNFGTRDVSSTIGVQYKHWTTDNRAYRLNFSYGEYNGGYRAEWLGVSGDTLIERQTISQVPVFYLGGGIEAQRQFFKRVYLYAAIDIRVGYGSGTTTDNIVRTVVKDNSSYTSITPETYPDRVTYFSAGAAPYIGAKLQFNRLSLGTEITAVQTELVSVDDPTRFNTTTTINMNLGTFSQRLYLLYRF